MQSAIEEIRSQGYTLLRSAQDPTKLLARIKELEPYKGDNVPYLNQGSDMIYNLQDKDFIFIEAALRNEKVNQILFELLNDPWYKNVTPNYILRSMIARSGEEKPLPLHIDSFVPSSGKYCWSVQVMFALEHTNTSNGCTVVRPGSHLSDTYSTQNEDIIPIFAHAGDILIIDSRLHHGAAGNKSGKSRWIMAATFTRWWIKQGFDIPGQLPIETQRQLTGKELAVMGYCSIPPKNEFDRIDIKGGYDLIP